MTPPPDGVQLERVRRFYDRSTDRFVRRGQGGTAIHRAVWGPGVRTRDQAFHHVEDLLLADLPPAVRPRVVDLGCGVGGSLLYLARRRDLVAEGITISPEQVARARELIAAAGLADRVRCREGDFLHPPADLAYASGTGSGTRTGPGTGIGAGAGSGADLAFSIEAFVHGPDPAAYFRAAAGLLRPGGRLVVCDDFLTDAGSAAAGDVGAAPGAPSPRGARRLEDFVAGWRVGSLVTAQAAAVHALAAGLTLVRDHDLTPHLELRRPRDRAITVLVAAAAAVRLPPQLLGDYGRSLVGGDALQHCLIEGLLGYRYLVFERPAEPAGR